MNGDDKSTEVLVQEVHRLMRKKRTAEARELLDILLGRRVRVPFALVAMAECMQLSDDYDTELIESLLRESVALAPRSADARLELAHFILTWNDSSAEASKLLRDARRDIMWASVSADLLEADLLDEEERFQEEAILLKQSMERYPAARIFRDRLESVQETIKLLKR